MRPPVFWGNPPGAPGLAVRLLAPFSLIWRAADGHRWQHGGHTDPGVPVICVGNINLGGTGKTPTVIWFVEHLGALGRTPHIVSRGYGGRETGPLRIRPDMAADAVGDEPLLLCAFAPTWVAKNRLLGVQAARAAGADVVVLDDGMQNPSVRKNFTVMVVDAGQGFGNGYLFPAGPLRQSVPEGLARADAVVIIGTGAEQRHLLAAWPALTLSDIFAARVKPLHTGMDWSDMRVFAFAGIGRPGKFFDTLRAAGATVAVERAFADHQPLSDKLMTRMAREANRVNAQLVTTEKDAARLPARWRRKVLPLSVRLEVAGKDRLIGLLQAALGHNPEDT
ncbi:MAG: tetraacyldisaccharide 4'-kinase [Rhodobacteraceae bacterium]|nr:tetraacyldisaccharide 4'-kinase [Paracoccaceae bacterium]